MMIQIYHASGKRIGRIEGDVGKSVKLHYKVEEYKQFWLGTIKISLLVCEQSRASIGGGRGDASPHFSGGTA